MRCEYFSLLYFSIFINVVFKFVFSLYLSLVRRVMLDTCGQATQWIVDKDESGVVTVTLSITAFSFYCGRRLTICVLALISAVVSSFMPTSSNPCIALIRMWSNCALRLTSLFQSDQKTSFQFWHLFVICKNLFLRHCFSRRKIFTIET